MLYGKVMMATYGVWPHISSFPSTAPKPINHCGNISSQSRLVLQALCWQNYSFYFSATPFPFKLNAYFPPNIYDNGSFDFFCRSFVSRHPPLKPAVVGGCTFTDLVVTIWIYSDFSCILFPLVCTQSAKWSRYSISGTLLHGVIVQLSWTALQHKAL